MMRSITKTLLILLFATLFSTSLSAGNLKRHSFGFEFGVVDFAWFFSKGDTKIDYNSKYNLDLKAYYDIFLCEYFSMGIEAGYFRSIDFGQDMYSQVNSLRINGRIKPVLPFYKGRIETFFLLRGGASFADVEHRGFYTNSYNLFGGIGANFEITDSFRIGALNDTGFEMLTPYETSLDIIYHMIRFLIFIEYRI